MKKVYAYITRIIHCQVQVLILKHPIPEAGIQIPKGTVEEKENTYQAVIREVEEETGLMEFDVVRLIAEDVWKNDDGEIHHRFFYEISVKNPPDEWAYQPTGGGAEVGLTFRFFWMSSRNEVELVRGHGDYLDHIFA
ncbi:NUDIX domain-containing protein [Virgibacillus oceani]